MNDEDVLVDLVTKTLHSKANLAPMAPARLATTVRHRLARRRMIFPTVIVSAAIVGFASTSLVGGDNHAAQTKTLRLAGYSFQVPAAARIGTSCLDAPVQWSASWHPANANGGFVSLGLEGAFPDGRPIPNCTVVAVSYTIAPPESVAIVESNGHTIHIAAPTTDGTRVAYIALTPTQTRKAFGTRIGSGTYYVIAEMPSDNDQSVLDAVLPQAASILIERLEAIGSC